MVHRGKRQQSNQASIDAANDRSNIVEPTYTSAISASEPAEQAHPSEEAIRLRAYELYQSRNGDGGDPADDWYRAERELKKLSAI